MAVDNIARGMAAKALENQGGDGSSFPIVNTAAIGQTIRVSAVDDAGKPTEWEAVEFPAGGVFIHRIARVVTEANAASIEITGLATKADVLSIRIYNAGASCGMGLDITVNGEKRSGYVGTMAGSTENNADVKAWLYRDAEMLYGRAFMSNRGANAYDWPGPGEITSIVLGSPYNDGESKYFQAGTIVEIYEGVYPNAN